MKDKNLPGQDRPKSEQLQRPRAHPPPSRQGSEINKNAATTQTQRRGPLSLQSRRHRQMLLLPGLFLQGQRNVPEGVGPVGLQGLGGSAAGLSRPSLPVTPSCRGSAAARPEPAQQPRPRRPAPPARPRRTCTMMAMRSESLGILSLHFLQEARPLLAYSTR